jgi:peptide/nickel transport system substrate-binding protein
MFRRLAVLAFLVLAACSRQATEPANGRHAWTQPHVLRMVDISDPDRLNPYLSGMDLVYDLTSLSYSYLIIADDRGRLVGDLATEVPTRANGGISADGTTYTYHLHRGVLWHDGVAFTSRDVVASWQAVVDPTHDTLHREGYDRIASIATPDAYTAVVHLKHRYPPFVTQFFAPLQEGGKPILPAHILAKQTDFNTGSLVTHPIGTGPFKFVRWDRGNRIVYERFDKYFKGRPKLDRIELRIIPDDNTELTEVALHHEDLVVSVPSTLYEQYKRLTDVRVDLEPWNAQSIVVFNASVPGLSDVVVRRAIASAIDLDEIITKVSHGVGEVAYNSLPPTAIGYERLPAHAYDPAGARATLDAAGWKAGPDGVRARNGTRLSFTLASTTGSSSGRIIGLQLQQAFRAVGMELAIKNYPYNQIFAYDGPIYSGKYDISIYSTTLAWDPDVAFYLGCDQWYPKGENIFRYCDPRVDRYEAAGLQTDDVARRAAAYRKAGKIIWETVPYLPIYELRRVTVRSPDLKNFSVNPSATPFWSAWQWDI